MHYIKSPINYTGNKYRLLKQFEKHFPQKINVFVDLFCGGATVGFNVTADKIILIDSNQMIINLLKYLATEDVNKIIKGIEKNINIYNLSYSTKYTYKYYKNLGYIDGNNGLKNYNKKGFYQLRAEYNNLKNKNTKKANNMLYTLMVYSFNNDIRFNSFGEYNLPVGKTDFNKSNLRKLIEYNNRAKEINFEFICADFRSKLAKEKLLTADFIYADPPYLITDAVYNESNGWNRSKEKSLISLLDELNKNGKKFALSNVLSKSEGENDILISWIERTNNVEAKPIDYHYRSSSYNKKNRNANEIEVLVVNR